MIPRRVLLAVFSTAALLNPWQGARLFSADAPAKPKEQTVEIKVLRGDGWAGIGSTVPFELVQIPAGRIVLKDKDGKEQPHEVKPIWMGKYEVRWDEFLVFAFGLDRENAWDARGRDVDAESRPSKPYMPPYFDGHINGYPAGGITFRAAQTYCIWLSKETGKKFRLPTEAEWEYACRAGGEPVKPDPKELDQVAWFTANAHDQTQPVGKKLPNAFGLYDMLGNVAEYVVRDPKDTKGLAAGGSWQDEAKDVSSAAREPYKREWQKRDPQTPLGRSWLSDGQHVGFRVVMED